MMTAQQLVQHTSALVKYEQANIKQALADVSSGAHTLSIATRVPKCRLTDTNIAGRVLLEHCMNDMDPRDVSFAANMYALDRDPTYPQFKKLKHMLKDKLGIVIEHLNQNEDGTP